ncbi:MAG TPA: sigma 54-interacting transcriptional regulator, partial [Planctomycetota bacterium]|nr:sigma 54-interacting transcriptional regulator [Planctomycetota bacterium]
CGPAGAGKGILARWLHFEGASEEAVLAVHGCGAGADEEGELWGAASGRREPLIVRARGGTVVLDDLERLAAPAQARLVAHLSEVELESEDRTEPRIVATVRRPLEELARDGQLRLDLAQRLQRLQIHVPALHQRREEIPGLAQHLAERFARELRRPEPSFSDEALALLWRQPWPGGVRELENLVYKLVLLSPGREVGPEWIEEVARRFRIELCKRLPSRHPEPAELRAALETTRTGRGSWNKTRAALYLGWDPDTLVSRMTDAGLLDGPAAGPGAPAETQGP